MYVKAYKLLSPSCSVTSSLQIDFDDQFIYEELDKNIGDRNIKFVQILQNEARVAFNEWNIKENKTEY